MFPVLDSNYMRTNAMIQIETKGHTFVFKINIEYKYITQGHTYFLVRIQIENNHSSPGYEIALFGL